MVWSLKETYHTAHGTPEPWKSRKAHFRKWLHIRPSPRYQLSHANLHRNRALEIHPHHFQIARKLQRPNRNRVDNSQKFDQRHEHALQCQSISQLHTCFWSVLDAKQSISQVRNQRLFQLIWDVQWAHCLHRSRSESR